MASVDGIGSVGGTPAESRSSASPLPRDVSSDRATPRPTHPALPQAHSINTDASRGTGDRSVRFSAGSSANVAVTREDLLKRAQNVRRWSEFNEVFDEVTRLPDGEQIEPLALLTQSIKYIQLDHKCDALDQICHITSELVSGGTDCSDFITQLPRAASLVAPRHQAYKLYERLVDRVEPHLNDKTRAAALLGLANMLPKVALTPSDFLYEPTVRHILDGLERLPRQLRMPILRSLYAQRFSMPPTTTDLLTQHAMRSAKDDKFTPEQRVGIAHALLSSLSRMKAASASFDDEFVRLFNMSQEQKDPQVRVSLLMGLYIVNNQIDRVLRLSPETRSAMHDAMIKSYNELGGSETIDQVQHHRSVRNAELLAMIEKRKHLPESEAVDSDEFAEWMAEIIETSLLLPDTKEGAFENPRLTTLRLVANAMIDVHAETDNWDILRRVVPLMNASFEYLPLIHRVALSIAGDGDELVRALKMPK